MIKVLKRPLQGMLAFGAIVAVMTLLLLRLPTGFLPTEDQGQVMVQFTLPAGASVTRTLEVAKAIEKHFLETEKDNIRSHVHVVRLQLQRQWPERWHGVREPEGLEGTQRRGEPRR